MNIRHFTYWVTALLVIPLALGAQSHDASVGNHELHLYAASDFGINAEAVTFTKDIADLSEELPGLPSGWRWGPNASYHV